MRVTWFLFGLCLLSSITDASNTALANNSVSRVSSVAPPPTIQIALTLDDIPAHGSPLPFANHRAVGSVILKTLATHQLREIVAFANLGVLGNDASPGTPTHAILSDWTQGGHRLANHTHDHLDLNTHSVTDYLTNILRNHELLISFFNPSFLRVFRFPFLHEGASLPVRNQVREQLQTLGYKLAPVTIDLQDWAFREPFERCLAKNDSVAKSWLKELFVKNAAERILFAHLLALRLGLQNFKHILLTHYAAFVATHFDELLTKLSHDKRFSLQWVSIDQALQENIYQQDPGSASREGSGVLEQWMRVRSLSWPRNRPQLPTAELDRICR